MIGLNLGLSGVEIGWQKQKCKGHCINNEVTPPLQVDEAVAVLQAHQAKEAAQKPVSNTAVPAV